LTGELKRKEKERLQKGSGVTNQAPKETQKNEDLKNMSSGYEHASKYENYNQSQAVMITLQMAKV